MNSQFKANLLKVLANKKSNKGFTLIELLVVVIIIGVLAAVALPNLLGQVGKARETEGKNGIGTINRAQQAYHFEKQSFASALTDANLASNNILGVTVDSQYYSFSTNAGDAASVTQQAASTDAPKNGTRSYAGGVGFSSTSGVYANVVCQSDQITNTAPSVTAAATPVCPSGSTALK
ncbi:prepilin-type N-terminal cleavage/methylation domain-containing protein [Pleurocapsa sp. PCC 7327]|uniref:type IV pilin protein n=1 Tax=Pleurocapsa sp. PCC 7327 TaxID=118163 RepID=UPI00029F97FF|nr:type IV pilin-like G/H family protein [Pleurocapsa sp. PCC 7327]AFY76042.1 prepilin-type N-terminal cleavage/methylation domain-containing protein [Pleurocapsa sp. PCC 7327]